MKSFNQANSVFSYSKYLRKYFHINPELSGQEHNTYLRIASELKKMNVDFKTVDDYSIVAFINKHKEKKKNIGFRAQIDAIAVKDLTNNKNKSRYTNISHSSGHDISMAVLLGVVKQIKENEDFYDGCVTFIFEASGHTYKGAQNIINSGLIDNVNCLYTLLCSAMLPEKHGAMYYDQQLLGADVLEIQWFGQSKPSAYIFEGKDAILAAANFTDNIRSSVALVINPTKISIISVTKFLGGHSHDISAGYCEITVNMRYQDNDTKINLHRTITKMLKSTEERFKVTTQHRVIYSIPPLIANQEIVDLGRNSFLNIINDLTFISDDKPFYSEGFSLYSKKTACSIGIYGAKNLNENTSSFSSEIFSPDEAALKIGISWYLELAKQYLNT